MNKKDTRSVAYIYNEMDPSERVEFEREIDGNSNLLIEVESMRKVSGRLDKLPHLTPPENVITSIFQLAEENRQLADNGKPLSFYMLAAAITIFGLTTGAFFFYNSGTDSSDQASQASVSAPLLNYENLQSAIEQSQPLVRSGLEPWEDRNEILQLTGHQGVVESTSMDSVLRNSFQKLTPVTDPVQTRIYNRTLHLTGSNR